MFAHSILLQTRTLFLISSSRSGGIVATSTRKLAEQPFFEPFLQPFFRWGVVQDARREVRKESYLKRI